MGKAKRLKKLKAERQAKQSIVGEQTLPQVPDIVRCDECGGGFSVSAVGIHEEKVKNRDLHVDCFICPHCNHLYVVFIKDAECRQLQEEMREVEKRIKKLRGRKKFELSERVHQIFLNKKRKLIMHEEVLKSKYSGTFTIVTSEDNTMEIAYLPRR